MFTGLPTSRAAAKAVGSKWYFTGKPCPNGHIDKRFTSQGSCAACLRANAMKDYKHTTSRRRKVTDTESFVAESIKTHGNHYDYSNAVYESAKQKVEIICPEHGVFKQAPTNHINGRGCPQCGSARGGAAQAKSTDVFIMAARAIWGDRFDYTQTIYKTALAPVKIICSDHGVFTQSPSNHLLGKDGCSKCNHMKSKEETRIAALLSSFTTVEPRDRTLIAPKELDIYLPDKHLAVEFCGEYWHSHGDQDHEAQNSTKHYQKHIACAEHGVRLITIYATEWLTRQYAVKRLLRNAVGKSKGKLMARKCELAKVPHKDAVAFYEWYHPQGGAGHGDHYGLYWKGKLVACMRFTKGANDRGGAKRRDWTLTRYATRITVSGGASRLFKAFAREYNPKRVKSFSDNRYFAGGMYEQLGFALESESAPDYMVWHQKLGLMPKSAWQRRSIPARARELGIEIDFDPDTDPRTERDMTYLLGARRIYDCGKKRWVWTP